MTPTITHKSHLDWITPEEQLRRLLQPVNEALAFVTSAETIKQLIVQYIYEPNMHNWHNALKERNLLPLYIPPLPSNFNQILSSPCPIFGKKKKPDNTHYTINDTHSLFLVPPDSIYRLIPKEPIVKTLFTYLRNNIPEITDENADFLLIEEPTWILGLNELLPNSSKKTHLEQEKMIEELQNTARIHYTFPTFKHAFAFSCLSILSGQSKNNTTYPQEETRVIDSPPQITCRNTSPHEFNLTVGKYYCHSQAVTPFIEEIYKTIPYPSVGVRPIWINFSQTPPPLPIRESAKCCTLL